MNFDDEKVFQDAIFQDENIKKDICACLNIKYNDSKFVREDTYINGITADFSLFEDNIIKAIIECKGGKINVTDYVRGIGQIFQYEYFAEHKLSNKNYIFCDIDDFSSVYIFPDSVLRINDFNVGLFKYPKTVKIIEINEKTKSLRYIDDRLLEKFKEMKIKNRKVISSYYIHDTRIFELYFLLKILSLLKLKGKEVHRKELENSVLTKLQTPNNSGWRNAFITLSTLGLITSQNYPSQAGTILANKDYEDFAFSIYNDYLKGFFEALIRILANNPKLNHAEIFDEILKNFNGEVAFLAEIENKNKNKNTRYISSYLNILRDDFAVFDFRSGSNDREIIFNPLKSNVEAFLSHIRANSKFNNYKDNFLEVMSGL
ncbi:MAG: hypothetical protein MSA33_00080 [Campylobacter sp.]|uniref:hypothetical protein n=1 Tax=Campylobacter sp. TaxID=205 RepID=UPI002AA6DE0E|nr:hypothetical protein [Campylobacter sp.]MCI7548840.1 hypothetical protein [Campylobacter sp.]